MKTAYIFLIPIIILSSVVITQAQNLKLIDDDDITLRTFETDDYISLELNNETTVSGLLYKTSESSIVLHNYSVTKLTDEIDSTGYSEVDDLTIELTDINIVTHYSSMTDVGAYCVLAGCIAIFTAPLFGINFNDTKQFNSDRYIAANLIGVGLLGLGITINLSSNRISYINNNASTSEIEYWGKSYDVNLVTE